LLRQRNVPQVGKISLLARARSRSVSSSSFWRLANGSKGLLSSFSVYLPCFLPSPIRHLRNYRRDDKIPGLEVEESLWLALSDASGWILKASPNPQTATYFSEEMLPFLVVSLSPSLSLSLPLPLFDQLVDCQGLMQASEHAIPLLSMSLSVMLDALDVLPMSSLILSLPPDNSQSSTSFPQFFLALCFQYVCSSFPSLLRVDLLCRWP
jgi:hypothetical protein